MEDTAWFEEKSGDEKLTHLSELMYSSEENAKKDFETLLNLLPVDLVLHLSLINILTSERSSRTFPPDDLLYNSTRITIQWRQNFNQKT